MKKEKIGLITGGIGHAAAFKFLKNSGYKVLVFDDDPNCYLKKKFINIKIEKINNKKNYNKLFFWSPCNDLGSRIADNYNFKKYKIRTNAFKISNNKREIYKKLKIKELFVDKTDKKKQYIKKPIFGSASRGISLYNGIINKDKFFLQEFIKGTEVSLEIYSFNGNHKIIQTSLRVLRKYKSALCIINIDIDKKLKKKIFEKIKYVYKKIQVFNGISHVEIIIDKNKKIYPIDINFRMGGAGVSEYLINNTLSINCFKIDFFTLKNNKRFNNFKTYKYGILIFDYPKNHKILKNKLFKFRNYGKYRHLKNEKFLSNKENDDNRKSMLYINSRSIKTLYNKIEVIFSKEKYLEIVQKIEKLKTGS